MSNGPICPECRAAVGHFDTCRYASSAMPKAALYCVHAGGERYWVYRFPRWTRRILDAIHVLRWGFMPS